MKHFFFNSGRMITALSRLGVLFFCILTTACVSDVRSGKREVDVLISNVTAIDAKNGIRKQVDVRLYQGEILSVAAHNKTSQANAAVQIDGTGKYLIPGLWDAHAHFTYEPSLNNAMFELFLAHGITSVRDTGGELGKVLSWKQRAGKELAPSVYIAGPLIDGEPAVYNGDGVPKLARQVDSPKEVRKTVDELAAAGVDLLKAYEMLTPESYLALLERAKFHKLPVTGHVPLSMSAVAVSNAGLNSMEHFRNLEMDCSSKEDELLQQRQGMLANPDNKSGLKLRTHIHGAQHYDAVASYDAERCDALLDTLAANQTWQVPTLTLMMASRIPYYADDEFRASFQYLPEPLRSKWTTSTQRFKGALGKQSAAREKRAEVADWKMALVKKLLAKNIPIMAGTDTPIFYLTPGYSLHQELETLVIAGMTPMQALESATITPARYFNKEDKQGTIEAGMLADLVLLDADPMDDIRNTKSINSVVLKGEVLTRTRLDSLLEKSAVGK